ncbi:hypothetical protein PMAA_022830 [Talaromyces marneffei ATCC 18224]|uniref:2EXR domain-containing protein n=1 Tax=Talaromyces marneffei (strain ATCC 18224 / CBS 334.59 / QM 7333) TaxID=441960 RepID=B6Q5D1_TALMQ|nr:hypothetical protein PMAA_022830 [Talaromyces marneffei ATCC 18224]
MDSETFHYFPQLPPEIRRMIWELCLPYRVAQVDPCDTFFDGRKPEQVCDVERVTIENAKQPVIAFVNYESRRVALEHGLWFRENDTIIPVIKSIWVQPRRDVLHLNWTSERGYSWYRFEYSGDRNDLIHWLLDWMERIPMERGSIVAELIHPFKLHALLDGADDSKASESPIAKYQAQNNFTISTISHYTLFCPGHQIRLDVVMAAISLHITKESAVRSGLFGLWGDAPIQLIDVDDEVQLRKYEAIYREHVIDKEPKVQKIFEMLMSPRFQAAVKAWKRQVEWLMIASLAWYASTDEMTQPWRYKMDLEPDDLMSVWVPRLHKQEYVRMSEYSFNESHPWVKEAMAIMAILRPRIMRVDFVRASVIIGNSR